MSYLPDLRIGDYVLVSGGAVLERIEEEEAMERACFADILLRAFDDVAAGTTGGLSHDPTNSRRK
jgi:hydrogenase maturation factor